MEKQNRRKKIKTYLFLHSVLFLYSLISICSKWIGLQELEKIQFLCFYLGILVLLFVYAILWQQVLKKFSLTSAFANKAIIIVWGILWGKILFQETVHISMVIGSIIIIIGIVLVTDSEERQ